ncbi:MAG: FeoA family protein [Promethearchaeia archaeon]
MAKAINDSQTTTLRKCLTECENGTILTVVAVNANTRAKQRLGNMGLIPGSEIVKKREAPFRGPLEIEIKGSSLAIGQGLAEKVLVECGETCPV